jgi:hypothetical protein
MSYRLEREKPWLELTLQIGTRVSIRVFGQLCDIDIFTQSLVLEQDSQNG